MEGTPFGRYVLLELLGRGGMGEVWRAHDTDTDRIVALKVLPAHLADDDTFQKRFRREARVAAGLYEPHVVPIHHFGEIDGRLYVDMRLIVGRDLETMLGDGPLDPARAVMIVEQIASALSAAHAVGLIHRDVKPSNILVADSDFAYLIDFGIARTIGDTGLTNTGSTIGTWAYMAPERFGPGEPDSRSDVYALACVLHQCLTGQRPFPGDSVERQVAGHLSIPPPQPSVMNSVVPQAIDEVIANGMAKNPDQRYNTTIELSRAARAAVTAPIRQQPPPPPPPPPTWNAPPPSNRPPADAVSPFAYTQQRPPAGAPPNPWPPQPIPAQGPPKRSALRPGIVIPAVFAVIAIVAGSIFAVTQLGGRSTSTPTPTAAPSPTTPPKPAGPTFEGTFTTTYGPQTAFTGSPINGLIVPSTWAVRSMCGQNGCVATATTVNRPEGVLTRIFDYIDGKWVSVNEEAGHNDCRNVDGQRWERTVLQPQPDGSMAGDFSVAYTGGGVCSSRSTVTFTRTGGADPSVQTADLATMPARVVSPAQALRGRYHSVQAYTTGAPDAFDADYVVEMFCLRTGDRCLNYLYDEKGSNPLVFASGEWTEFESQPDTCNSGKPQLSEFTTVFQLPQPPQDPIQLLAGKGTVRYTGGCPGNDAFDSILTRTGD